MIPTGKTKTPALADRYTVPVGDVRTLEQFVDRIQSYEPVDTNDMLKHERAAPAALATAAERILATKPDPSSSAHRKATAILLQRRIMNFDAAPPAEQEAMFHELYAALSRKKGEQPLDPSDASQAMIVVQGLESSEQPLAAVAYRQFAELFAGSEDFEIAELVPVLKGAARRLALPGQVLSLRGHRMDGTPFDLAELRGKVVLVDFWATWCQPCVAEHDRIRQAYDAYHAQGFEVVGVSMDVNRGELEQYLKEHEIPWITLHEGAGGGQNPAVRQYGVAAIPLMILVDRQGRVVSLKARGEELNRLLSKYLDTTDKN